MYAAGYRTGPPVDADRRPVGIVTVNDVVKWLAELFPEAVLNLRPGDRLMLVGFAACSVLLATGSRLRGTLASPFQIVGDDVQSRDARQGKRSRAFPGGSCRCALRRSRRGPS
jgi:hypothetical protein